MPSDSILVAVFHNSVVKGVRSEIPCTDRMAGFSCARATKHKSWRAANVTVASATELQGSHKSLACSGNVPIAVNHGRNLNVSIAAIPVIGFATVAVLQRHEVVIRTFNLVARNQPLTQRRDCLVMGNRTVNAVSGHRPRTGNHNGFLCG